MPVATRITVVLVGLLVGAAMTAGVFLHQGYRLFAITSGSMAPTLATGDLVVTSSRTSIQVGDMITFGSGEHVTTHRVAEIAPSGLITRGDANRSADAVPVDPATVTGEVVASATAGGYVLVFFKQPTGAPALVAGLVAMVSLWGLFFPPPATPTPAPGGSTAGERRIRRQVESLATPTVLCTSTAGGRRRV